LVTANNPGTSREGLLYGLAAYGWWGLVPLYFKALGAVPPGELLAHRIVWSVVFLAPLLSLGGRWGALGRCFRSRTVLPTLLVTTLLIAVNWFIYIYSVSSNQVVQSSLGYFILPLANVVLGLLVFGERLRRLQWWGVGLAAAGVLLRTVEAGQLPWLALALAATFSVYGLLRKLTAVDGLVGVSVETLLLLPAAVAYLGYLGAAGASSVGTDDLALDGLLLLSGVVTAVPLLCFGQAARRLRLTTLGFLQYLSPSLQLLLAVGVFGEPFRLVELAGFVLIWSGLVFYVVDAVLVARQLDRALVRAAPSQARP
jgi:chloramphenicol-sensitive protein RarD